MWAQFLELTKETSLEVSFGQHVHAIPANEVAERNHQCQEVLNDEATLGSDFLSQSPTAQQLRQRWTSIWRWDFERVLRPIVERLPPAPGALLYDATGILLEFSARRALWQGLLDAHVDRSIFDRLTIYPAWGGPGLAELAQMLIEDRLPPVELRSLTLVVGSLPSALEADLLAGLQRAQEDGDPRPLDVIGTELLTELPRQVFEDTRTASIIDELVALSHATGFQLHLDCDAHTFIKTLHQGPEGGTLLIAAHQDEHGLHFSDGALEMQTIRSALAQRRGQLPWSSVLAMVCGAAHDGNLAHCMQAAGTPIVMTHGHRTFRAVSLGSVVTMIRDAVDYGPVPLGRLVDHGVLHFSNPDPGLLIRES